MLISFDLLVTNLLTGFIKSLRIRYITQFCNVVIDVVAEWTYILRKIECGSKQIDKQHHIIMTYIGHQLNAIVLGEPYLKAIPDILLIAFNLHIVIM